MGKIISFPVKWNTLRNKNCFSSQKQNIHYSNAQPSQGNTNTSEFSVKQTSNLMLAYFLLVHRSVKAPPFNLSFVVVVVSFFPKSMGQVKGESRLVRRRNS